MTAANHARQPLRLLDYIVLVLLLAALFVPGTAGVSLFDRDEGWYARITREMVETGRWLVPSYLGESNYFKPAWMYWWAAASVQVLGWSEFALRLPCVIASIAAWLVTASFAARWLGRRAAYFAVLIAATSLGPNAAGKLLLADAHLLLFLTVAMCSWLRRLEQDRAGRANGYLFWASLGLSVLAKGPAALIVVVPVGLVLLLTEPPRGTRLADRIRRVWPGPGWYVGAVIGLWWYAAVCWLDWPAFKTGFVDVHLTRRVREPIEGHWGPPGYYLLAGLIVLWPWAVLAPGALVRAWDAARGDAAVRRLLIWLVAPWFVLELIQTKLPHYVLPLAPAMAMLLGRATAAWGPQTTTDAGPPAWVRRLWAAGIAVGALLLLGAAGVLHDQPGYSGILVGVALLALTGVPVGRTRRCAARPAIVAVFIGMIAFHQVAGWWILPSLEPVRLGRRAAETANDIARPGEPVYVHGFEEPSMFYYVHGPVGKLRLDDPRRRPLAGESFVLIAKESRLDGLSKRLRIDLAAGRFLEGVNYVVWGEARRPIRVWVGRVEAPAAPP